ncbi:pyrimidine 5'-nucleotidase [Xanthobacter agilis]|jgi:putative hydrolase of the HAD superfamily|uniref:Hydrolase of the HAD superfamily n=1 Tax=Xanthobacter agilis TaxID=47492 RepID=A0ABU0L9P2_XANAG|nr:pyrimidine 5'-nucleotidase [Xanthobacter agilis]MDQ0503846.1 putative hydrolase of the HAD superfamily [Xanthobacter agilis]
MTLILPQSRFQQVETWVFDLDNTLYSADHDLWSQIDARMKAYIADFLGIAPDDAFKLQKDYYRRYGTSLRGLMIEHGMDPDAFLDHVHDIDLSGLSATPRLGAAIDALPGRKMVYTNGSERHARNVLEKLGIDDRFSAVHDIVAARFQPKPTDAAYRCFLDAHGVDPRRAAMFEDLSRNLEVPHRLGMATVLVVTQGTPAETRPGSREAWELEGRDAAHVDQVTDDLPAFLERLV